MRFLVQRVNNAKVDVLGKTVGRISKGYMVLVGIRTGDTTKEADFLINKLINLRVFEDKNDKMNLSIKEVNGEILLISQFTLYGDAKKGNRPSFIESAKPEEAIPLYEYIVNKLSEKIKVETGEFGGKMDVSLVNHGPVTILLEKENEQTKE